MSVPKLRFPEFWDAGEWEEYSLIEIAKFRRGSFPQPYGLPEWYDEENGIPFIQVFDVNDDLRLKAKTKSKISKQGAEQSVFIPKGTLIVTLQVSIGRVAITQYDAYIDRTLLLFERFHKPIEKLFFAYVIQNLFEIEKHKAPGGIIKTITKEVLSDFKVNLPDFLEQQKIADCLSSLDDRITAETQKLDTLKFHKKGLMQQLFPAEGETLPNLRFPEFQNAEEWEERKLEQLASIERGKFSVRPRNDPRYFGGLIPFVQTGDIVGEDLFLTTFSQTLNSEGLKVSKLFPRNTILITIAANIGDTKITSFDVACTDSIVALQPFLKITNCIWLKFYLDTKKKLLNSMASQNAQKNINLQILKPFPIFIPSLREQQKIADCLSWIDEAIAAQSQMIDLLKLHKKGLMQQLFTSVEEVKR